MRPEDIKVGTVFRNIHGGVFVVERVAKNKDVKAIRLEEDSEKCFTSHFSVYSEYAEECKIIFSPEGDSQQENDLILPPYYATDTPYEPFKIGDFYNMNIREFSALKYLLRSKDESKRVEDLRKAITCIHKEIIRLESLKESGN